MVQRLSTQLEEMQKRITELQSRPRLNSQNASKPNPKSLRIPGQNPNGGQSGHSGNALMQSAQPDVVIQHTSERRCPQLDSSG